jgi:hypothetical protein
VLTSPRCVRTFQLPVRAERALHGPTWPWAKVAVDDYFQWVQPACRAPQRMKVGIAPVICDAEMVTLSVMQALLRYTSQARWLRFAREHLRHLFPFLPQRPVCNKRLRRRACTLSWLMGP